MNVILRRIELDQNDKLVLSSSLLLREEDGKWIS